MAKIPERFIWAAEFMQIKPEDSVLEIGCGTGILAELIAGKLVQGKYLAVDKSPSMLEKARKRNRVFIDRGVSDFIRSDFSRAKLPAAFFDVVVAFNVNFFWKDPAEELRNIRHALKKEGKLFIFYQAPYEIDYSASEPVSQKLLENSWEILQIHFQKMMPVSAFCIVAKPAAGKE